MKITLLTDCLCSGGAERVCANLSIVFFKQNYKVQIISFQDNIVYDYKGELVNLGKLKTNDKSNISNQISRLITLKKHLKLFSPDIVIDFRSRFRLIQEIIMYYSVFKKYKTILTIHSSSFKYTFIKSNYWVRKIHNSLYKTVCVSNGIEKLIKNEYNIKNTHTIFNPLILKSNNNAYTIHTKDYILAVGRMNDNVKGFDLLLKAYSNSEVKIHLDLLILGEGKLKNEYTKLAKKLNIKDKVVFLDFQSNIANYYKNARFSIMSSRYEGFGMVLIESLSCKIPVVSFNTPHGPSEIIEHEQNGLLVEYLNTDKLSEALDRMYFDKELYNHCKSNSKKSVEKFKIKNIIKEWEKLF